MLVSIPVQESPPRLASLRSGQDDPADTVATIDLSVVIASVNDHDLLVRTLDALVFDVGAIDLELVLVTRGESDALRDRLACHEAWGRIRFVTAEADATIPAMRAEGIAWSQGAIVAILEDHVVVEDGWVERVLTLHQEHPDDSAIGGRVENGRDGLVDTSAFYCEYARYMGPLVEGPCHDLPGNHVSYKRTDLMRHLDALRAGRWESWVNDRLLAEGKTLRASNALTVRHIKPFGLLEFLDQRFHYARSFAGMRRADQSLVKRWIYLLGSSALPALLLVRIARLVLARERRPVRFLRALPLLTLFLTVGAIGEGLGYGFGPGRSLQRVA